ncbi:MAG TPA: helix-turn-helix domain-containing protein [Gemmatimonadaceae bacterium]|jgi:DNA-binding HxlR family transcriptional regulator
MSDAGNICPRFHVAVELIGGRWTGAIISRLLAGRARYNELRAAVPEISDRMLSERLRALECEGLLTRTVVPETPVRVEYELTTKGHALEDALDAIGRWATKWISDEDLARAEGTVSVRPVEKPRAGKAKPENRPKRSRAKR